MKSLVKVACVGAGYFSRFHTDAWKRIPETQLCGIYDADQQRAGQVGVPVFADVDALLSQENPDVLDIITPPPTHVELIRKAIAHGTKLIICQKPFCESVVQAIAITEEAEQAGVRLVVHENFRFQPWFREVRKQLEEETLGEVQQALFRLRTGDGQGPDAYLERQPYFQKMPRFLIHETGVHYIDTFCYLFGKPQALYADLRQLNPAISGEDSGIVVFDFPHNIRAVLDGNRHLDFSSSNTRLTFGDFLVEGTRASLMLYGDGRLTKRQFGQRDETTILEACDYEGFAGDCVHALNQHIVEHLINGRQLENQARDYLEILELEQRVYESAEQGRKLSIGIAT